MYETDPDAITESGFDFYLDLRKSHAESHHGAPLRIVEGIAATEDLDQQREELLLDGMDFVPYLQQGWVNWNHQEGPQYLIGKPLEACIKSLGNGKRGFYTKAQLLENHPMADATWSLIENLEKSGWADRKIGWSVQGGVTHRSGHRLVKSVVRHMAITHEPVNACTFAQMCKSMVLGLMPLGPGSGQSLGGLDTRMTPGVGIPGTKPLGSVPPVGWNGEPSGKVGDPPSTTFPSNPAGPGNAGSSMSAAGMRLINTLPGLVSMLWGDCSNPESSCYDPSTGRFHEGRGGALEHLVICKSMKVIEGKEFLLRLLQSGLYE